MHSKPLVSVIIPSYNSRRFLIETVESALAQSYPHIELIVVDDGSTDDTATFLAPYQGRLRYVYQENRGPSAARNRGIAEARGELLAFLDADDLWLPDKVSRQVDALCRSPRSGLVHTDVLVHEQGTGRKYHRVTRKASYVGQCSNVLFTQNQLTTSSVLLYKKCLTRVGMLDETCRHTDDYDLWLRIARHYEFCYIDEPLVIYRLHDTNITRSTLAMRRDELYVLEKTLRDAPSLRSMVGSRAVRRRLYQLMAFIGYLSYEEGDYATAHHYLSRALRIERPDKYISALWALTFLPAPMIQRLQRLRRSLFARQT
jgi:glycosyltransferase involved in cell wall biosynthesis